MKVKTYEPIMGRRNFTGRLTAVEGDHVIVEIDNESLDLSWRRSSARLVQKF